MSDLITKYQQKIVPQLQKELGLKNPLAVPRVEKVVVNLGLGEAVADKNLIAKSAEILSAITGQKPKVNPARLSISSFKLRKGMPIGLKVTLRGKRMYHFLEKLFRIVLPRLRDFQGVPPKGFDGRGNYNLGLPEQIIFPEVEYEKIDKVRGLEVSFITSADSDKAAKLLLGALGLPFAKSKKNHGQ